MGVIFCSWLIAATVARAQTSQPAQQPAQPLSNLIHRASTSQPSGSNSAVSSIAGGGAVRVVLSLGAVIGLILLLYWASRRLMPRGGFASSGSRAAVEVLARTAVSPRNKILLLRVGRRILVVGEGGPQLTTLCEITDPDEAAALLGQVRGSEQSASKSFASLLDSATSRFREIACREPAPSTQSAPSASASSELKAELTSTHQELDGLAERVRLMARQFGRA